MGIKQDLATLKTVAAQGSELLLLRLRVLQMDVNEQMRGVLMIAALIAAAAVLLLVMLVALLLGLNVVLTAQAKMWLFFGVAAASVPAMWLLLWRIPRIWQRNTAQIQQTLAALQQDLAALSGSLKAGEADADSNQSQPTGASRDVE